MSSPNLAVRVGIEPLRTLAFGSISGTYTAIGTALTHPCRQFILVNGTDAILTFSIDGTTDHFVLLPGTSFVDDINSNSTGQSGAWMLGQGITLYVKGSPGSGSVYFSVFYGAGTL